MFFFLEIVSFNGKHIQQYKSEGNDGRKSLIVWWRFWDFLRPRPKLGRTRWLWFVTAYCRTCLEVPLYDKMFLYTCTYSVWLEIGEKEGHVFDFATRRRNSFNWPRKFLSHTSCAAQSHLQVPISFAYLSLTKFLEDNPLCFYANTNIRGVAIK